MLNLRRHSKRAINLLLSLSLGLMPVAPVSGQESDFSKSFNLVEDMNRLLDRAAYPDIPRRGAKGLPSASEMAEVQSRLISLKRSVQDTYFQRVLQTGTKAAEIEVVKEMEKYFEAVSRYEGLKIMLGQSTDPDTWESLYNLKFPLSSLSQATFLETVSAYAQNAVLLPVEGYDREQLLKQIAQGSYFVTHLEPSNSGQWQLTFRLNPAFAQQAERFAFLTRPSLKSGLQYAAHFSMHRLYDSLVLTRKLLRQKPEDLPAPPEAARQRFLSLRVARFEALRQYQTQLDELLKPAVYKTVLDAAEKSGVSVLNDEYFRKLPRISSPQELAVFSRALSAVLNLIDVQDWEGLPQFLLYQSKRLSLRTILIGNEESRAGFNEETLPELEQRIDAAAQKFAAEVLAKAKLAEQIKEISEVQLKDLMLSMRLQFQEKLEKASALLRDYRKQDINITYISNIQAGQIEAMTPSRGNADLVQNLGKMSSYENAYHEYKKSLALLLREFTMKGKPATLLSIDELTRWAPKMEWNPEALKGKVPEKYVQAMNPQPEKGWLESLADLTPYGVRNRLRPVTGFTPSARQKDLMDLLTIGRLLKFNVYEKLEDKPATVENMKLDDTMLGPIFRSESRAYLEEMKKDLLDSSPLLGGIVKSGNPDTRAAETTMLWEYLARPNLSGRRKLELVERQLRVVERHIHAAEKELAGQLAKVDAVQGGDVSHLSAEMRTVATRSWQISKALEPFASFESFYSKMRQELDSPGFVREEWQAFSTWANSSMTWMIGIMALQLLGSRVGPAAALADQASKLLTPICGPNFQCITPVFFGLIGISLSDQVYRGFGPEATRLETLRRYFETGSAAPGVSLYRDVKQQYDVMMTPRYEALQTVVMIVAIMGAFRGVRALMNKFSTPGKSAIDQLKRDLATLGLAETSSLSQDALKAAAREAMAKARAITDVTTRIQTETYVTQVYARLESHLRSEAASWLAFEQRYADIFRKLGLSKENWTDAEALVTALKQIETRYKNGQLLRSDYQEQMAGLMAAYQKLAPVWQEMEKSLFLINYYRRVWQTAANSSDVALGTSIANHNALVSRQFLAKMDEFYGNGSQQRLDTMIENIATEIKQSPELRRARVEQLTKWLEKGAGQ